MLINNKKKKLTKTKTMNGPKPAKKQRKNQTREKDQETQ